MGFKIDMHIHTHHSGDNEAEPEAMVQEAIRRGLDGMVFTEHYSFEASEYAEGLREKYADAILIFRGVELSAAEGHCLIYGVNTDPLGLGGAPMAEVVRVVGEHDGVVVPSHPYRRGSGIGDLVHALGGIVAIEGYNGCNMHAMNMAATEAAGALGLPTTGGSDAHAPREVGACYTEFRAEVAPGALLEALRAGRYAGVDTRKVSRLAWMP